MNRKMCTIVGTMLTSIIEIWIIHSDTTHLGRKYYKLEKYTGAEYVTDSVILYLDEEKNEDKKYYVNGTEVTESKYKEVYESLEQSSYHLR